MQPLEPGIPSAPLRVVERAAGGFRIEATFDKLNPRPRDVARDELVDETVAAGDLQVVTNQCARFIQAIALVVHLGKQQSRQGGHGGQSSVELAGVIESSLIELGRFIDTTLHQETQTVDAIVENTPDVVRPRGVGPLSLRVGRGRILEPIVLALRVHMRHFDGALRVFVDRIPRAVPLEAAPLRLLHVIGHETQNHFPVSELRLDGFDIYVRRRGLPTARPEIDAPAEAAQRRPRALKIPLSFPLPDSLELQVREELEDLLGNLSRVALHPADVAAPEKMQAIEQPCAAHEVLGEERMLDRFERLAVLLEPARGAHVHLGPAGRIGILEPPAEKLGEQMVIPIPVPLIVQAEDEEIERLQPAQHATGVGALRDVVAQLHAHAWQQ